MRQRLDTIQLLRAFAALAVVFYHSIEAVSRSNRGGAVPEYVINAAWLGNAGVDIFFVISGFIMIYVHYDDFSVPGSPFKFMTNRLKRIVPNYWLLTTVGALVLMLMPALSQHGRTFDTPWIVASYLFIPWTSDAGIPLPVLGLGWTLNYEMYFYLVFSFALLFPRRLGVALLTLLFILSIGAGMVLEPQAPLFKQATSWLLAEFLVGVGLGVAFKSGCKLPHHFGTLLLFLAVPVILASFNFRVNGALPQYLRFVFFGLPAVAIVVASTLSEGIRVLRMPSFIVLLGNASYALYLTHVFTLPFTGRVLSSFGVKVPFYVSASIFMIASTIVAVVWRIQVTSAPRRVRRAP